MGFFSRIRRPTPVPAPSGSAREIAAPCGDLLRYALDALDHVTALTARDWRHVDLDLAVVDGGLQVVRTAPVYGAGGPKPHATAHRIDRAARETLLGQAIRSLQQALMSPSAPVLACKASVEQRDGRVLLCTGDARLVVDSGALRFGEAFDQILDRRSRPMLAREDALAESIASYGHVTHFDAERSMLFFCGDRGRERGLEVVVLGTHTPRHCTWKWSWTDEIVVRAVADVHRQRAGLAGMWTAEFPCDASFAHTLAMVAADELGSRSVYSHMHSQRAERDFFAI